MVYYTILTLQVKGHRAVKEKKIIMHIYVCIVVQYCIHGVHVLFSFLPDFTRIDIIPNLPSQFETDFHGQ